MAPSSGSASGDLTLRRYLLGALSDEETEQLDELSIVDDEFVLRLRAAEDDLVDAYANGELTGEDLDRFTSQYLAVDGRRARVDFAQALKHYQPPEDRQDIARTAPARVVTRLPAPRWLATAATFILAATLYLLVDDLRLRRDAVESSNDVAALQERQRRLEQELNTVRSASDNASQELARLREAQVNPGGQTAQHTAQPSLLAFILTPSMRDASTPAEIRMPRGTRAVTLRLRLEGDDFPAYQAVLKEATSDRIVWSSGRLQTAPDGRNMSVSVELNGSLLEPKLYVVDVAGIPVQGASKSIATYPFRVVIR